MRISAGRIGGTRTRTEEEEIRAARVRFARGNQNWEELERPHLVRRGPWLVHEPSDRLFVVYRGTVFSRSANFAEATTLAFTVGPDDTLTFFERVRHPATWSEVVERQARRAARTRSPL